MNTAVQQNADAGTRTKQPAASPPASPSLASSPDARAVPAHLFTNDDYLAMIDAGVLGSDDKVELIDGTICDMSPQSTGHGAAMMRLMRVFASLMDRCELAPQITIPMGEGRVVDPDLMLLRRREDGYQSACAKPEDVLLLIEVASTSQVRDREVKPPIYAAAGVADYWVVDIPGDRVFVHRGPAGDTYSEIRMLRRGEKVTPIHFPDFTLDIADLLGPPVDDAASDGKGE